jgi:lysophospholipase L1-like esterase
MAVAAKRILCLGDSNTYGYDPRDPFGGRYPKLVRWTGLLERTGYMPFNRGMNGLTVPVSSQYGAFSELVTSLRPLDAAAVMLGTNDILQGASAAATAERLASFLEALRAPSDGAVLILLAPPPVTYGDWVQSASVIEESQKLSARYREIAAEQQIVFADAGLWNISLTYDGVHFTPEGHAAFYKGLESILKTLF